MFENIKEANGEVVINQWVEWDHYNIPNSPGWILEPEGKIRNTTPFGGWVK